MTDLPPNQRAASPLPLQGTGAASAGTLVVDRGLLLRALTRSVGGLFVVGAGLGFLLFGGDNLLERAALPYYVAGLAAVGVAMMLSIWLHGRFAATRMPGATSHAVSARLTGLLGAAMAVKMGVLVLGFVALKQFPLSGEAAKFSHIATFAVTFAAGAVLCQLGTAWILARALGRRSDA